MREKRAKQIRKFIYKDQSIRQKREYETLNQKGTIKNCGIRADYQKAKKEFYKNKK